MFAKFLKMYNYMYAENNILRHFSTQCFTRTLLFITQDKENSTLIDQNSYGGSGKLRKYPGHPEGPVCVSVRFSLICASEHRGVTKNKCLFTFSSSQLGTYQGLFHAPRPVQNLG